MTDRHPNSRLTTRRLLVGLIVWNLIDIAIHIAADRVEFARVASNVVLIAAAAVIVLGRAGARAVPTLTVGVIIYLGLNLGFIVVSGPALVMTILIVVSVAVASAAIVGELRS